MDLTVPAMLTFNHSAVCSVHHHGILLTYGRWVTKTRSKYHGLFQSHDAAFYSAHIRKTFVIVGKFRIIHCVLLDGEFFIKMCHGLQSFCDGNLTRAFLMLPHLIISCSSVLYASISAFPSHQYSAKRRSNNLIFLNLSA